ncbi:MAG: hypothetical protein Q8N04_09595 [Nitrospira sp.]|nr:hypothetical protein [Nitrospira sp.]
MVKKWPDGPVPGSVIPRLRQSTEVRVSLAAIADGMGEMVWIAAGQGPDVPLVADTVPDHDRPHCCPEEAAKDACERGGFGVTGGQFYKPEEGP